MVLDAPWTRPRQLLVGDVAEMFGNILCVAHGSVRLILGAQLLNPDRDVSDYNIQSGSTLSYILRAVVTLYVQCDLSRRGDFALDVLTSDTIEDIKAELHIILRIPPHRQRLTFADVRLEDGRTLADYMIVGFASITVARVD